MPFFAKRFRCGARALISTAMCAAFLSACGQSEKFNRSAYEVCLEAAKKSNSNIASASFEAFEKSLVASSTGDDQFRVSIPYELNGRKGLYQCIAAKLQSGKFEVVF
ncbi:MAG: hypothetical protein HY246_12180 [Proteobacteria bacterium]|nr:hypothetical protein [Pseudomonadota bacterium]